MERKKRICFLLGGVLISLACFIYILTTDNKNISNLFEGAGVIFLNTKTTTTLSNSTNSNITFNKSDIKLYWGPPIRKDGKNGEIDIPKTILALKDLGFNAFAPVLTYEQTFNTAQGYNEFINLLKNTKDAGIQIMAILSPPNLQIGPHPVTNDYPYHDYISWTNYLANLSLSYPQLTMFTIDDMSPNNVTSGMSSSYITQIIDTKNKINSKLEFVPTLYFHYKDSYGDIDTFNSLYKDGSFMWHFGPYQRNMWWGVSPSGVKCANQNGSIQENCFTDELKDYINSFSIDKNNIYLPGIYPIAWSNGDGGWYKNNSQKVSFYSDNFITRLINTARGKNYSSTVTKETNGVAILRAPLDFYDTKNLYSASIFKQIPETDTRFSYRLGINNKESWPGWYQEIQIPINTNTQNSKVNISFRIQDNIDGSSALCKQQNTNGFKYYNEQLLFNGNIIWEQDLCSNYSGIQPISKSLTISGENVISIRITSPVIRLGQNENISVDIGNLLIKVNGVGIKNNWLFKSGISYESDYIRTYNAIKKALGISIIPIVNCTDSDGGKNIYMGGTVNYGSNTNTDSCIDVNSVKEYYCDNNASKSEEIMCGTNYTCVNGACISIDKPMSITLIKPTTSSNAVNGETIVPGSTYSIQWVHNNNDLKFHHYSIYYKCLEDVKSSLVGYKNSIDDSSISWVVPNMNKTGCRIYIYAMDAESNLLASLSNPNEQFRIGDSDSMQVKITAPLINSTIPVNSVYSVRWSHTNFNSNFHHYSLYYKCSEDSNSNLIGYKNDINDSSIDWTVPSTNKTGCKIYLYAMDGGSNLLANQIVEPFSISE